MTNLARLDGVHRDLVRVIEKAKDIAQPFIVTEGIRSLERQAKLYQAGLSQTVKGSRHLTGHAVDLACLKDGKVCWDWPLYEVLARDVLAAASLLNVPVIWGGVWKMRDGCHFELSKEAYPA